MRRLSIGFVLILSSLTPAAADDIAHGKRVFKACASCHVADSPTNKFGPSLFGVVGRKAGAVADYAYSDALKAAAANGLVWDEAALSEFLSSPKTKIPGTSMRFWGLWTETDIRDVIAYLKKPE